MASTYQQCIVAFLDILGFRDLVTQSVANPQILNDIIETLTEAQAQVAVLKNPEEPAPRPEGFQVSMFSDSFVFSCPQISDDSFNFMATILTLWQKEMTTRGYFLRGAIASGPHYHQDNLAFGPAFIDAYDSEKLAVWPRVIVQPDVLRAISPAFLAAVSSDYLARDSIGGLVYLDYLKCYSFSAMRTFLANHPILDGPISNLFALHRKAVLGALGRTEHKSDLRILTKYRAVADYHNWVLDQLLPLVPEASRFRQNDPNTTAGRFYRHMYLLMREAGVTKDQLDTRMDELFDLMRRDRRRLESCRIPRTVQ